MVIKKFSSKLVRFKLTIKRKIELPRGNNLGSPLQMQNSHPVKHLSMSTSKTLLGMDVTAGFVKQAFTNRNVMLDNNKWL